MDEKLITEIREYLRRQGGWAACEKYGRELVLAAFIPED
jgi:hypothetical protein